MKKGWVGAAFVLALLAGLGWFAWTTLQSGHGPDRLPDSPRAANSANPAKPAPPEVEAASSAGKASPDATPTRAVEAVPPPAPAPEAPMPESYRKALSGIRGRLVEEDGKPVAGLEVELLELPLAGLVGDFATVFAGAALKIPDLSLQKTRSAADGTFELRGTRGAAPHALGIDLGGARGSLRIIDRTLNAGEVADLGDLVLGAIVTFRGKVEDEDGKPIAGARVRAAPLPPIIFQPGVADLGRALGVLGGGIERGELIELPEALRAWEARLPLPTTKTGADGAFELTGVPQGLVTLIADREGYCGSFKGPQPSGKRDRDIGALTLGVGRAIRGVVVDAAGKPVAQAEVVGGIEIPAARMTILFRAESTGADGRFAIEHLSDAAGGVVVGVRASKLASYQFQAVDDASRDVTLTVAAGETLEVLLVDRKDAPVNATELWFNPLRDVPLLTFNAPRKIPAEQIERLGDGHVRLHGITGRRAALYGIAPGFARASVDFEVAAEMKPVKLVFEPAAELAVEVVDAATKAPVEWATVSVASDSRSPTTLVSRRTDATGAARLPELPAGGGEELRLRVFHPEYAPQLRRLALGAGAPPARFELTPGAAIHGHVHSGGAALTEPVLVMFQSSDGRDDVEDDFPRLAVPGLDGTFTLKGLAPKRMRYEVLPRLFGGDITKSVEKIASVQTIRRGTIDLVEGQTAEIDIDLDPRLKDAPSKLFGRVHVRGGASPEKLVLVVQSSQPGNREPHPPQRFDVRVDEPFNVEVPAGWINVSLVGRMKGGDAAVEESFHQDFFSLDPGQSQNVDMDLEFVHASFVVVDGAGQPCPHVGVAMNLRDERGAYSASQWRQADDAGQVEVDLPKPGRWQIQVNDGTKGTGNAEFEFPSPRVERVVLERGVPCSGRVEVTPDLDDGEGLMLWFLDISPDHEGRNNVSVQLAKGTLEFDAVGLSPGTYRVHLYGSRQSREQPEIVLPEGGRRDFVLKYKLEPKPTPPPGDGN